MDKEFPANSRRAREGSDEKKVDKVIEGSAIRRKKPPGRRFADLFISGDSSSVAQYVFLDVLLPAAKDMIADAVSQGVERMIFGEARSTSRRSGVGSRNHGPGGYVSYNRYAQKREEPSRGMSRQARATHTFDEIVLETRREAEEVLDRLFDMIEKYETATVSDLYELVGETSSFADEKWGWVDLRGAKVSRVRNGYLIELPKPTALD